MRISVLLLLALLTTQMASATNDLVAIAPNQASTATATKTQTTGTINTTQANQTTKRLRVGVIYPLTGSLAKYGKEALAGVELALEHIMRDAQGHNIAIELLVRDNASSAKLAASIAMELITKHHVQALIGAVSSAATLEVAKVAQEKQKIHIIPISSAAAITKMGSHVFRSCVTDDYLGKVLAKFAVSNLQKRRATILLEEGFSYQEVVVASFRRYFQEHGGTVIEQLSFNHTNKTKILRLLAAKSPEVVLLPSTYRVARDVISQAQRLKVQASFLGIGDWQIKQRGASIVSDSMHYYASHFSAGDTSASVIKFLTDFKLATGREPSEFAAMSYDALLMLNNAVQRAGSVRSFPLLANLSRLRNSAGLLGKTSVDRDRNAIKPAYVFGLDGTSHYVDPIWR
ncbi:MAG: ABC transporter substrate-binding protein [Pseudomonadota bacterium]|nr:ABC transporter substrate-binding protein [Pseudomonadota bacterium]